MESQESDLCPTEDMDMLMATPGIADLMYTPNEMIDWGAIEVPIPNPTGELPARVDFPGAHFFDAKVDMTGMQKKNYVLSLKLNKVFVDLGKVVPIQIKWDGTPNLYVRALMVFTQADQLKLPVKRCVTHREKDDPSNANFPYNDHVLAMENDGAEYLEDPVSKRHSVKVPLNLQSGCEYSLISLKFMCKTSCTGGLNRAPTDVIFTLEDVHGQVLGRQIIGVKICSCPKRDCQREEECAGGPGESSNGKKKVKVKREEKEKASHPEEPPLKKIKQEFPEDLGSSSFMVNARNPEIARVLKEHLVHWNSVKMWDYTPPGTVPIPIIEVIDQIAVLPPPYN